MPREMVLDTHVLAAVRSKRGASYETDGLSGGPSGGPIFPSLWRWNTRMFWNAGACFKASPRQTLMTFSTMFQNFEPGSVCAAEFAGPGWRGWRAYTAYPRGGGPVSGHDRHPQQERFRGAEQFGVV